METSALTSAISEADLNRINLVSNEATIDNAPAPSFHFMLANGQLERPIATVLIEFELADFECQKPFTVMFRKTKFLYLKMTPMPLLGTCLDLTLSLDLVHLIVNLFTATWLTRQLDIYRYLKRSIKRLKVLFKSFVFLFRFLFQSISFKQMLQVISFRHEDQYKPKKA